MPGKRRPATLPRPGLALPGVTGSGGCRTGRGVSACQIAAPVPVQGMAAAARQRCGVVSQALALPLFTLDGHGVVGDRRVNEPPTCVNVGDRPVTEPMRYHRGGSWAVSATVRFPAAVGDPGASRVVEPGSMLGDSQGGCARRLTATSPHCGLNAGSSLVLDAGRGRTPACADALIGVIETRLGSGATLPTARQPWSSASGAPEPHMHPLDPGPKPPAGEPAAQGRRPARRAAGPPGFTYEVQLLGGEAGRRLAQQQTEAIAELLAWLAGHPPTPPAAAGPAATAGKPVGPETGDAGREAAQPSPVGAADASMQPGRAGGRVRRHLRGSLVPATSRLGVLAAWWRNGKSWVVGNGPVASGRCCAIVRVWSVRSR
jgi:hypothetical protein